MRTRLFLLAVLVLLAGSCNAPKNPTVAQISAELQQLARVKGALVQINQFTHALPADSFGFSSNLRIRELEKDIASLSSQKDSVAAIENVIKNLLQQREPSFQTGNFQKEIRAYYNVHYTSSLCGYIIPQNYINTTLGTTYKMFFDLAPAYSARYLMADGNNEFQDIDNSGIAAHPPCPPDCDVHCNVGGHLFPNDLVFTGSNYNQNILSLVQFNHDYPNVINAVYVDITTLSGFAFSNGYVFVRVYLATFQNVTNLVLQGVTYNGGKYWDDTLNAVKYVPTTKAMEIRSTF